MAELMRFPEDVNDFMEDYKMVDNGHYYSNGIEYVPIFRMKQWFEHQERLKENREEQLKNEIDFLSRRARELEGEIHGLMFALRCNGISGAEVGY